MVYSNKWCSGETNTKGISMDGKYSSGSRKLVFLISLRDTFLFTGFVDIQYQ